MELVRTVLRQVCWSDRCLSLLHFYTFYNERDTLFSPVCCHLIDLQRYSLFAVSDIGSQLQ